MGDFYGQLGVIGGTVAGGYAERCLVPSTHVHRVPDDVSWHAAAAFPTAFLTAHHALFESGRLAFGETVLVHAAGSGVSTAAIQLARHAGATVLATAGSDEKCVRALGIGAHHVANNREVDVAAWLASSPTTSGWTWCSTTSGRPSGRRRCDPSSRAAGWSTAATRPATR